MVDRMSQRREKCGASVNIARGWCPRQWTSHGNNTNTTTNNPSTCQTPRHPARIFKCKSGKKGAGEIERIKVPPDKEAQTRPWCRPSRKINYRSTLIVEVTAAQPGQQSWKRTFVKFASASELDNYLLCLAQCLHRFLYVKKLVGFQPGEDPRPGRDHLYVIVKPSRRLVSIFTGQTGGVMRSVILVTSAPAATAGHCFRIFTPTSPTPSH